VLSKVEREKLYHDRRFIKETRDDQGKYYFALKTGASRFEQRVLALARDADVLEYGCGAATQSIALASIARSVSGIDISDVAIQTATRTAAAAKVANVSFSVMDAEALTFPDKSFDLVFGRGILHHLDLDRAYPTIARVLRPGGVAFFTEPLGHNPLLNAYRSMTPDARTPDEHPLRKDDLSLARRYYRQVYVEFYGLTTILSVPFRDTPLGETILNVTTVIDSAAFKLPGVKWQAWASTWEFGSPLREIGPD
jgi:SAM-dependent methyltransferase